MTDFELSRRQLLKALGGGVLALAVTPDALAFAWNDQRGTQIPQEISAWVHIAPDGKITVFTGKVEVGQNARTSVTQAAAEELRVDPASIKVVMGDTDLVPFDMGTFGSRTTPTMIPQVRRAAAAAREALIDLAVEKWNVERTAVIATGGMVTAGSNRLSYGELAKGQSFEKPISRDVPLTAVADWKHLGKPTPKVGASDIVTGSHEYTSDLKRPDMLYAKVLRGRSIRAELTSADTTLAEKMPGVKVVRDGEFLAVAAPTLRQAQKALAAIKSEWREPKQPSTKDLATVLRGPDQTPSVATGDKPLKATYVANYIAHVPLEPRAALAEWDGKRMTVHTGTQRPFGVRDEVAEACALKPADVRVIVPDTGSGYGGKHSGDAAVEAAKIAKALGKPVKLVWTRQEEFAFAYFRPGGVIEISSAIDNGGKLSDWTHDNYNSGPAALETPYAVAKKREQFHRIDSPLRQGSYRGLAATFNAFAREVHMDELAKLAGKDPLEFRLDNLSNVRLIEVLKLCAENFGWPTMKAAPGRGFGIACGIDKGGYVATAAEVEVKGSDVKVLRVVIAFECGAILNPELLANQVEGGMIMGLGGALFEKIEFDNGAITTDRLSVYRVPRYSDMPRIETVLHDRKDLPSAGSGECPIIGIAPAISGGIFMATGKRLRSLPLQLD